MTTETRTIAVDVPDAPFDALLLADSLPQQVWTARPDGTIEHVNAQVRAYFQRPLAEIAAGGWASLAHPDDAQRVAEAWGRSVATGEPFEAEFRLRRHDGEHRWHIARALPQKGPRGVERWYGSHTDIEDQKRASEALRESELRYSQILDSVQDMVFTKRAGSVVTYVNKATADYYGVPAETLRGVQDVAHNAPAYTEQYLRDDAQVFATGKAVEVVEELNIRADGQTRVFHTIKTPIFDSRGNVVEVVGVSRDVTARKAQDERLAAALQEVEQQRRRLDEIVASVPGVVWESWEEPDVARQRIDFVSGQVETLLGYTPQEWLSARGFWLSIVHPEDRARAEAETRAQLDSGTGGTLRFRWRRKDGEYRWAQSWTMVIKDDAGQPLGMRGVTLDITALVEAETAVTISDERFRLVSRATNDAVWDWDLATNAVWWNDSFRTMFGYDASEIESTAESWTRRIHPDDLARVKTGILDAIAGTTSTWHDEYRFRRKDGTYAVIFDRGFIIRDAAGKGVRMVGSMLDLTQMREGEERRRESEERFRRAFADASIGMVVTDPSGLLVEANAAFTRLLGYEPADIVRTNFAALTHPDDVGTSREMVRQMLEGRTSVSFDKRYIRRDGTPVWTHVTSSLVRDAAGRPLHFLTQVIDVSERKRAEAELQRLRHDLELILDSAGEGIYGVDAEGTTTFMNAAALKMLGLRKEEAVGRKLHDVIHHTHPDGRPYPAPECPIYQAAHGGPGKSVKGEHFFRKDGSPILVDYVTAPIEDGGRIVGAVTVFNDVTELRVAEDALRESEARYRFLADHSRDMITRTDAEGRLRYVSPAVERLLGYAPAELIGRRPIELIHPEDAERVAQERSRIAASGETGVVTMRFQRKDGSYVWLEAIAQAVVDPTTGATVEVVATSRDVTERRRAEAEIREGRDRLEVALSAADLGTWDLDLTRDTAIRSLRHDQIFGYPEGAPEWGAARFFQHILPEHADQVRAAFDEALRTGRLSFECQIRRADGALAWIAANGLVVSENGRPVRMLGVVADVTERVHAREAVEAERTLLTTVLQQLPAGVLVAEGGTGRLVLANDRVNQILRHEFQLAEGLHQYERYVAERPDGTRLKVEEYPLVRALTKGEVVAAEEMHYCLPTGERIPILVNAAPVRDAGGSIVAAVVTFVDISRLKEAEQEIRYQRDLTRTITDNAGSALFMMDARGHPIFMNAAALEMTGYGSIDEIAGRALHEAVHFRKPDGSPYPMEECPIDRANAEIRALKNQREIFCRKDGSLFPVEYNVAPVERDGVRLGAVLEVRDITERLRAETALRERAEELARLTEALSRSNRELDQFAYITSHDLKAPLRGIANLSRWIEEDLSAVITEESKEHLDLLRGRVNRMEALIDAILEYSRVGRVTGRSERVPVGRLVEEAVDLLAPPSGFRVECGELPTVVAEKMRLQQVFMNLIGNAIKHHHDKANGVVRISAEDEGSRWRFTVADNGPGIAPRFHDKVFVIFQTLEARDKVEGTGIGLALVKKIVESNGGVVTLDSDVGRGAAFTFTWPKADG